MERVDGADGTCHWRSRFHWRSVVDAASAARRSCGRSRQPERLLRPSVEAGEAPADRSHRPGRAWRFERLALEDEQALLALFAEERPDVVVNLAAQAGVRYSLENPAAYIQSNLVGFGNLLEGCRYHGTQNLVYASSSSVYGGNRNLPFHERQPVNHPVSLYAASKKANELMAHTYSHLYGLPATGLRFFTVYGPWGRPDMAPMLFARAILAGEPIKVFNHGKMQRITISMTSLKVCCAAAINQRRPILNLIRSNLILRRRQRRTGCSILATASPQNFCVSSK